MAAVTNNFVLEQGSDFSISFQYNDENGNGLDLSDSCVLLRWKQNDNNETIFITLALLSSILGLIIMISKAFIYLIQKPVN